jgi:hypothetical protein
LATVLHDEFVDGLLDQGRAKGEAAMLLRVLAAPGFTVPDDIRQRIQSCTDLAQIETCGERAVTANSLDEIFTAWTPSSSRSTGWSPAASLCSCAPAGPPEPTRPMAVR